MSVISQLLLPRLYIIPEVRMIFENIARPDEFPLLSYIPVIPKFEWGSWRIVGIHFRLPEEQINV